MTPTDRRILAAATMTRTQRQYLAVELGMSVPAIMQRMLMLADDPAVIALYPRETRAIRDAREVGRRRRSGSRLLAR